MNKAKNKSKIDGKKFLQEAFAAEQQVLKLKLELSSSSVTHDGVMGDVDEKHFIEILRRYLPNRYAVDSGIIIDSNGKCSDQIDVVIYDKQYTPSLLDQQSHRFIPVEAVYAVFEVKPSINKHYLEYAAKKAESVRKLTRTSVSIPYAGGEYPPKPLFSIISGIVAGNVDWKNGFESKAFLTCYSSFSDLKIVDCGVAISYGSFDVFEKDQKLKICSTNNSLIYFIFRFLQKLQSLGTVPAIDWNKYAAVFE